MEQRIIFSRDIVLEKLTDFLNDQMTPEQLHAWALSKVVTTEYEEVAQNDELLRSLMQAIVDFSQEGLDYSPTRDDLESYRKCLTGEEDFDSLQKSLEIKKSKTKRGKKKKQKSDLLLGLRIYVVLFALCLLIVNGLAVFNPESFNLKLSDPSLFNAFKQVSPHLLYAAVLLIPIRRLARGLVFYAAFAVFVVGFLYYWSIIMTIAIKLSLPILLSFVIAPFTGIPATVALLLLIEARKEQRQTLQKIALS